MFAPGIRYVKLVPIMFNTDYRFSSLTSKTIHHYFNHILTNLILILHQTRYYSDMEYLMNHNKTELQACVTSKTLTCKIPSN